jgi:RHS repeat-associated protein
MSYNCDDPGPPFHQYTIFQSFVYHDAWGGIHYFNGQMEYDPTDCDNGTTSSMSSQATDGSGYLLSASITNAPNIQTATVTTTSGQVITPPLNTIAGSATAIDRNGNEITSDSSGDFYDTLSSTTAVLTYAGSGTPSSPMTFTYTAPSGASASYTMNYTNYTVATNFGVSGISEYKSSAAVPLVTSIVLPDNSQYSFTYEATPGTCTPYSGTTCVTGRVTSITLPTGGTISYSYSFSGCTSGNNGIFPDGSTSCLQRTTPDGTWTYAQVKNTGAASTTTVTAPQLPYDAAANQTVIQFQGIYETQRHTYQGSTGGTLLQTVNTCYNNASSPCTGTAITLPITQLTVTDQYGSSGLQGKHNYVYNSVGVLTEQDDYDFGSGAPGSLLRKTLTTYAPLGNITAFRQTVTICNGTGTASSCTGPSGSSTGTMVAQTNYNYDETALALTSGVVQHTSISGSRGNLTSINYPVSGLTAHFTYYDTGSPNTSQDVNGATTTYNYGTDNTANCQMAFPTSISEPLNLSRSMTWKCNGGVQLTSVDENSQTTTTAYTDAYFWRPASVTDALSNPTYYYYQPNPNYCCPAAVGWGLTFNNGNSAASDLQYMDGLGRTYVDQRYQSPGSPTLDSVSYTFDANGRPYSVSMPCAIGFAGTCSTPKTTTTYDALNRPLQITDGGGGTVTYTYPQNDVLVTISPAPTGENTKSRQLEYDALGRLTSVCEITGATGSGACGQTNAQTGFWTKYTYDALGDLLTVTQNAQATSGQQTRSYTYDAMSRLTSETNPESGTKNYVYDSDSTMCTNGPYTSLGDLVKTTDAAGNCVMRYYDSLHRLTDVGNNNQNLSHCLRFRYDNSSGYPGSTKPAGLTNTLGRLIEAATDACVPGNDGILTDEWFSYTARGEVSDVYESTPHSGAYYHANETYWANGALNGIAGYIGSTLNYQAAWNVDGEGRPYSGYPVTSTTYNAASQPTQVNFNWGDSDSYTYDPKTGRMTQYQFTVNGQSNTGTLNWNANSTLGSLSITDAFNTADNQTCNYAYDDLTRIASANCASAAGQTFTYDPFGNIDKSGSPYSFQPTYSSATNQMTNIAGFTPTYDANGNVTNDSNHTYSWDAYGNAITLDGVGLTYDASDRMVEQNRSGAYTQFVYAPTGFKMQILNGQTVAKNFVPLAGGATAVFTSSGLTDVRHADWLGSSRFASTPSRTMYFDTAYAPFGEPYAQSGTTDLSFTGQNSDTTSGIYDFLYRPYSIQGRWPTPDPAGLAAVDPTNPQSWNRYAYVLNGPINLADPSGLYPVFLGNCEFDRVDFFVNGEFQGSDSTFIGCWDLSAGPVGPTADGGGGGNTSGGGPSLWTVSKNLNRCAAQLAQTKSLSALSGGRIPEVLGSNFFSDISTLATGGGGLDQGAGIAAEGTIQVAEHAGAQVAVGTVTTISTPISATAGVYNPIAVGTASQSLGGTVLGRVGLGFLKAASIAKIGWDGAMYLAAEAACAAPAWTN